MQVLTKEELRHQLVTERNINKQLRHELKQVSYINEQLKINLRGVITLYKDEKGIPLHISESSKFEHYRLSQADCYLAELNKK